MEDSLIWDRQKLGSVGSAKQLFALAPPKLYCLLLHGVMNTEKNPNKYH